MTTQHTPKPLAEVRAAMKWWRAEHPEYTDAKVRNDGWHGRSVYATSRYEFQFIESISDVLRAYRAALAKGQQS